MSRSTTSVSPLFAAMLAGVAWGLSTADVSAQSWQAGSATSDVNSSVLGLRMWDPDGSGPLPPVLAAIGSFTQAGATAANRIATWDGTGWSTMPGSGLNAIGSTAALCTLSSNNDLFCAGTGLSSADGVPAKGIAGWDGSSWFGLDSDSAAAIVAVSAVNADTLVIAGFFTSLNGVPANRIATWNTTAGWSALDDGTNNGLNSTGTACLGLSNGNIVVSGGGDFTGVSGGSSAGPLQVNRVARWDGAWHAMGSGFTTTDPTAHPAGTVRAFLELPNGDVIAGGSFVASGATALNKIARWDHTSDTWVPLGPGINNDTGSNHDVYALARMTNGDIVAAGDFTTAIGTPQNYIARWHPATSTWSAMAPGDVGVDGPVRALAVLPNGDLAVGGDFLNAGGQAAQRFTIWHEPPAPPHCPADFNNDGVRNVSDIFDFLESWFSSCP